MAGLMIEYVMLSYAQYTYSAHYTFFVALSQVV
jgi:hypothetical protein